MSKKNQQFKMEENIDLLQKIKTLESHFGKIVATVKHLKTSVDSFKEQIEVRNYGKIDHLLLN